MSLRTTVTDAKGRRVPLVAHEAKVVFGADERSRRILAAASAVKEKPTPKSLLRATLYIAGAVLVLALAAFAPSYVAFRTKLPWWAQAVAMLPTVVLPALVTIFVSRRVTANQIAKAYVRAGFCASCGYDLTAIVVGDDGLQTCPECGAAWANR